MYWEQAEAMYVAELTRKEQLFGKAHIAATMARMGLSVHYGQREQFERQYQYLLQVADDYRRLYPNNAARTASYHIQLGIVLQKLQRYEDAKAAFQRAMKAMKRAGQRTDNVERQYAELLMDTGQFHKAERLFRQVLTGLRASWGKIASKWSCRLSDLQRHCGPRSAIRWRYGSSQMHTSESSINCS